MVVRLKESVTVSAKVDSQFRKKMVELGISPPRVIKKVLEAEVTEREMEILRKRADEAGRIISKVRKEEWGKAIREARDRR